MQPYFLPYAGYFRLFAAVDEFVLYDCVQFPRRGRVHRTEVPDATGRPGWLTLPLAAQPREVLIRDLAFAADARAEFDDRLQRLPWLRRADGPLAAATRELLDGPLGDVTGFLERSLSTVASWMGFSTPIRRSSSLSIDPQLRGQERVIAIAQAVGATHYLNSPGGRALYDPQVFAQAGMSLEFLAPYTGSNVMLLPALARASAAQLREDLLSQLRIDPA